MFSWHGGKRAYGPERRINAVSRRLVDTANACRRIGFRAEVSVEEGLRRLVHWWKATRETPAARVSSRRKAKRIALPVAPPGSRAEKLQTEGSPGSEV